MGRCEEVVKEITDYCADCEIMQIGCLRSLARTLADEVDDLRADIAAVKAESLRVVEVASMYNIFGGYSSGYFRWNGMIWRKNRQDKTHAAEINQNEVREFLDSAQVEWIRLEPWRADA